MKAGIESYALYTPECYIELEALARVRGVDPEKYRLGLGQERMAVATPDEDIVTMAASAARRALVGIDTDTIDTVMFATESGVDQSKAAAIYVHRLLGLPMHCRTFEIKQACSGSTAAVQMALALVRERPERRVLVVASDVARYGLGTPGEPTQGAGAVAMVISSQPKVLALDAESGSYTEDVMDFWRPNYLDEALVDGKYSIKIYLKALSESWKDYSARSGRNYGDFSRFCYHLPFCKMAEKAHTHLARIAGTEAPADEVMAQVSDSLHYIRNTGNSYTASLYVGLASMLETTEEDLTGHRIALFSYGSGCMATFLSGVVQEGYRDQVQTAYHSQMLEARRELDFQEYVDFYKHTLPTDGREYTTDSYARGRYRLAGIRGHKRIYERGARSAREEARKAEVEGPRVHQVTPRQQAG